MRTSPAPFVSLQPLIEALTRAGLIEVSGPPDALLVRRTAAGDQAFARAVNPPPAP